MARLISMHHSAFRMLAAVALIALQSGCATSALWKDAPLDAWNEPYDDPGLKVFASEQPKDFLVVYREYEGRHDSSRVRAYWVLANQERIAEKRKPSFTRVGHQQLLAAIPVFTSVPTNSLPGLYAVTTTNRSAFAIYSQNGQVVCQTLPAYKDSVGTSARVALTPLAVACDLTVVGGFIFLEVWSEGGLSSVH
jgi:hypothetical protein